MGEEEFQERLLQWLKSSAMEFLLKKNLQMPTIWKLGNPKKGCSKSKGEKKILSILYYEYTRTYISPLGKNFGTWHILQNNVAGSTLKPSS